MKISVIIPIYNGEKYIKEAIKSVLSQPYRDIEVICIDDGSIDNSSVIIQKISKIDDRVKIYRQDNCGVSVARNNGIKYSKGEYIAFLDADDIWIQNVIDIKLIDEIKKYNTDVVSFEYYQGNQKLNRLKKISSPVFGITKGGGQSFGNNFRSHSSYFYKRKFILNNQIEYTGKRQEDERFRSLCVFYCGEIYNVKKQLFVYRNNSNSTTHNNSNVALMLQECIVDWKKLLQKKSDETEFVHYCEGIINRLTLELRIAYEKESTSGKIARKKYLQFMSENKISDYVDRSKIWMCKSEINEWNLEERHLWLFHLKQKCSEKIHRFGKRIKPVVKLYELKKYPIKINNREGEQYEKNKDIIFNS